MSFSFIALNRVAENKAAHDAAYRAELKRNGKVLLSEARALSDEALLAKLAEFGFALDREGLRKLVGEFLSAEAIYREVMKEYRPAAGRAKTGEDWVWFAFTLLWERWFPDIPSLEMFDERMQEGYRLQEQDARTLRPGAIAGSGSGETSWRSSSGAACGRSPNSTRSCAGLSSSRTGCKTWTLR